MPTPVNINPEVVLLFIGTFVLFVGVCVGLLYYLIQWRRKRKMGTGWRIFWRIFVVLFWICSPYLVATYQTMLNPSSNALSGLVFMIIAAPLMLPIYLYECIAWNTMPTLTYYAISGTTIYLCYRVAHRHYPGS